MNNRLSLKGQNRGASLIAVLVAIIVVGVIGVIITELTITNIRMKDIEQQSKKTFYNAEEVMDDLSAGLNDAASVAMKKAYKEVLGDYKNVLDNGEDIQNVFAQSYLKYLTSVFSDTTEIPQKRYKTDEATGDLIYEIGQVDMSVISASFSDPAVAAYLTSTSMEYHADYNRGQFILQGVSVNVPDSGNKGYTTAISTDMVFEAPKLNFSGSNQVKDFMRYSVVADDKIEIGANNITVDGNAYAGAGGILGRLNGSASFTGDMIVTRGDIVAESGSVMNVGRSDGTSRIWAENMETNGNTTATMKVNGRMFISDDLSLNAKNSDVTLQGSYYGYNFQKNYESANPATDAAFSSAIVINGRSSKLDITGLNHLLVAGRTYIAKGKGYGANTNKDVMMGESLAVRSNQIAYYVPEAFLETKADGSIQFIDDTYAAKFSSAIKIGNVYNYVSASNPVVPYYYYNINGGSGVAYYLKFNSEQSANNFFAEFAAYNADAVSNYGDVYLTNNAIILDDATTALSLKGDILYRSAAGDDLSVRSVSISGGQWGEGGGYFDYANSIAMSYKSLQMYLEEYHIGIGKNNVRFENESGAIDKTLTPLMNNIMDVAQMKSDLAPKSDKKIEKDYGGGKFVVMIDNAGAVGASAYNIPTSVSSGIIIATGDVYVQGNFTGMIIAGGTISFAANASVTADELMVSNMFMDDVTGSKLFCKYFRDFATYTTNVTGEVSIDRYMTYSNWTKAEN